MYMKHKSPDERCDSAYDRGIFTYYLAGYVRNAAASFQKSEKCAPPPSLTSQRLLLALPSPVAGCCISQQDNCVITWVNGLVIWLDVVISAVGSMASTALSVSFSVRRSVGSQAEGMIIEILSGRLLHW